MTDLVVMNFKGKSSKLLKKINKHIDYFKATTGHYSPKITVDNEDFVMLTADTKYTGKSVFHREVELVMRF